MGLARHLDCIRTWLPRLMLMALTFLLSPEGMPIFMNLKAAWFVLSSTTDKI